MKVGVEASAGFIDSASTKPAKASTPTFIRQLASKEAHHSIRRRMVID
jgi:hypothetical protein